MEPSSSSYFRTCVYFKNIIVIFTLKLHFTLELVYILELVLNLINPFTLDEVYIGIEVEESFNLDNAFLGAIAHLS